jgi:cytochrome c-type biogenesis protein CcmH
MREKDSIHRRSVLHRLGLVLSVLMLSAASPASAVVFEPLEFSSPTQEQRYRSLLAELRCLVCQNQNLADSDAALAGDLRAEVYRMIQEGLDDSRIVEFMVARYGDFVLYRPPWKATTLALWLAPVLLLVVGLLAALRPIRRSASAPAPDLTDGERARLQRLLDEAPDGRAHGRDAQG